MTRCEFSALLPEVDGQLDLHASGDPEFIRAYRTVRTAFNRRKRARETAVASGQDFMEAAGAMAAEGYAVLWLAGTTVIQTPIGFIEHSVLDWTHQTDGVTRVYVYVELTPPGLWERKPSASAPTAPAPGQVKNHV